MKFLKAFNVQIIPAKDKSEHFAQTVITESFSRASILNAISAYEHYSVKTLEEEPQDNSGEISKVQASAKVYRLCAMLLPEGPLEASDVKRDINVYYADVPVGRVVVHETNVLDLYDVNKLPEPC